MGSGRNQLTIPDDDQRKTVFVSGARSAYMWHGKLHVLDKKGMRRTKPFPLKKKDVFRIIIVGDSLTYGKGVGEEETYASVLQLLLEDDYYVEVLNLGINGKQSEDINKIIREFTPRLNPNLVVYGICLNDFLPSGLGIYKNNKQFSFPIPLNLKRFLIHHSKVAEIFEKRYDTILLKLNLRRDFFDDILLDFRNYQGRFLADLVSMNQYVIQKLGTPIVSGVFYRYPKFEGRAHRIAMIAEESIEKAGMVRVPMEEYFRKYNGKNFAVSPWEGHPNAEVHTIFARYLEPAVRAVPKLQDFKKD